MRVWEQSENEGARAFGLFRIYLELGPDRSLQAVVDKTERSLKVVKRIYYKFRWSSRARAYDNYLARVELDAAKRRIERDAVKWVGRFSDLREEEWELGNQLVEKAKKMLSFPLTTEKVIETAGPMIRDFETGELVPTKNITIIINPVSFSFRDAKDFAEAASKLKRMASGKETERKLFTIDPLNSTDENLQNAKDLYARLQLEYAGRPDVLQLLPLWIAEQFGFEPRQLEGTVEGEIVDDTLTSSIEQ